MYLFFLIIFSALVSYDLVYAGTVTDDHVDAKTDQTKQSKDNQMEEKDQDMTEKEAVDSQIDHVDQNVSHKKESEQEVVSKIDPEIEEIKKHVEFASHVTGVRKEFLMGMLIVESDLGRNTGECTYQEVMVGAERAHKRGVLSKQAWDTFQERKQIMQNIANELGYDYEKVKVSCNPPYAGTGGAMGIPQFMPDTWMEYKDKISEITGESNPNPWNARDGVLAMALKVADVPGVVDHNVYAERNASKMYLSGSTSSRYEWYASKIQYWAKNYEKLIG